MSTQHPDNALMPFFASNSLIEGDDEVQEAYYAFSHLGCTEQMWDCEGKEVDAYVVKKLLTKYSTFFEKNRLGRDLRLTLRVPNPAVEKTEAKILLETLEGIPRSFDTAQVFYNDDIAPIFEVILPMTSSAKDVNMVYHYYRDFVAGKQSQELFSGSQKISEWIGRFMPSEINVIPLIETHEQLLSADKIVSEYLKGKNVEYQRVFLARSDPAQNYGLAAAVLLDKIALQKLSELEEKSSVEIFPIIGVGSVPFRGNLKPTNTQNCLSGYPSVQTFTMQSAFKYDFPQLEVTKAVEEINSTKRKKPVQMDEKKCLELIERYSKEYANQVSLLEPLINKVAAFVPKRRKRKLHIGLFGYSRQLKGKSLPRTITFCASLYSIGLPPEILGLNVLMQKDLDYFGDVYKNFQADLKDAMRFYNPECKKIIPSKVSKSLKTDFVDYETDLEHAKTTSEIISRLSKNSTDALDVLIARAAYTRKFLG